MMMKPKAPGKKQKQFLVGLPDELRASLDAAASEAGHSVGEEIRRRLRASEADSVHTKAFLEAVRYFAERVRSDIGVDWFAHPAGHIAFAAAIELYLQQSVPSSTPGATTDLKISSADDAATIGRTFARGYNLHQTIVDAGARKGVRFKR